jgi:hypothetical protein
MFHGPPLTAQASFKQQRKAARLPSLGDMAWIGLASPRRFATKLTLRPSRRHLSRSTSITAPHALSRGSRTGKILTDLCFLVYETLCTTTGLELHHSHKRNQLKLASRVPPWLHRMQIGPQIYTRLCCGAPHSKKARQHSTT